MWWLLPIAQSGRWLLTAMAVLIPSLVAVGDEQDSELVRAWLKVSRQHAEDYRITPTAHPDQPYELLSEPVFRHSQPVRGDDIGAVYLWVDQQQRPAVIGTTFAYTAQGVERNVVHELHSLTAEPLTSAFRQQSHWSTTTAGWEFKPIPRGPQPAMELKRRQAQARDLVRRFAAESTDHDQRRWELRLVPKPIHQYEIQSPTEKVTGALFVLSQGTDPEVILGVESRQRGETWEWVYAAALFTDFAVKLRLDDEVVWSRAEYDFGPRNAHYCETVGRERLPK